ncbi:MAG: hypothetical protein DRG82_10360, partial [Deltaproteobacteria bacterium]
ERAKKCYAKANLDADWQAVVADVRKRHFRKKGFMAGFEDIVTGAPKQVEPSFLERAKARWPRKPNMVGQFVDDAEFSVGVAYK